MKKTIIILLIVLSGCSSGHSIKNAISECKDEKGNYVVAYKNGIYLTKCEDIVKFRF